MSTQLKKRVLNLENHSAMQRDNDESQPVIDYSKLSNKALLELRDADQIKDPKTSKLVIDVAKISTETMEEVLRAGIK